MPGYGFSDLNYYGSYISDPGIWQLLASLFANYAWDPFADGHLGLVPGVWVYVGVVVSLGMGARTGTGVGTLPSLQAGAGNRAYGPVGAGSAIRTATSRLEASCTANSGHGRVPRMHERPGGGRPRNAVWGSRPANIA